LNLAKKAFSFIGLTDVIRKYIQGKNKMVTYQEICHYVENHRNWTIPKERMDFSHSYWKTSVRRTLQFMLNHNEILRISRGTYIWNYK